MSEGSRYDDSSREVRREMQVYFYKVLKVYGKYIISLDDYCEKIYTMKPKANTRIKKKRLQIIEQ